MKKISYLFGLLVVNVIAFFGINSSYGATFTVDNIGNNTNNGGACNPNATNTLVCAGFQSGPTSGSLAWCITMANSTPGADIIDFNLPTGSNIAVSVPGWLLITDQVTIDATINGMAAAWAAAGSCKPIIEINYGFSNGFDIQANNCSIKGILFSTAGNCITFSTATVTSGSVKGCWFGLNQLGTATGTVPQQGIRVMSNASGVIIGGTTCATRNVLLGSNDGGILFDNGDNNTVIGNYFNTKWDGSAFVSPGSPQACIRIQNGSVGNIIGTSNAGEGNLICANNAQAIYNQTGCDNTQIVGNKICTDLAGNTLMPGAGATHSIHIEIATGGLIQNNTMAICGTTGIQFSNGASSLWTIKNNNIGIGANGTSNICYAAGQFGIQSGNNTTKLVIDGNVLGFATQDGIQCDGPGVASINDSISILNNKIGTQASGLKSGPYVDYGFGNRGIFVKNFGRGRIIGNVICDNGNAAADYGIQVETIPVIFINNNYLGVDISGNTRLGNYDCGLFMGTGAFTNGQIINNVIGDNGFKGGALFPNKQHGIQLISGTYNNFTISNNHIGIGSDNATNVNNSNMGIGAWSLTNSTISNNAICNNIFGIFFNASSNNTISGNTIRSNDDAGENKEGAGICFQSSSNTNTIQNNTINNNKTGIWFRADPGGTNNDNIIYGNTIWANGYTTAVVALAAGTRFPTENNGQGIVIGGGSLRIKIGGTAGGQPNTIFGNRQHGVLVTGNSDLVHIRRNKIYCNGSTPAEQRTPNFAIRLNVGNSSLAAPGPITNVPPQIAANAGIPLANIPNNNITAGDVVEVFYDNGCGCQLQTYLGDGIAGGTFQWSYPAGGNPTAIPAGGYCVAGAALPGGGVCPASGINSVTATRTQFSGIDGRTSEPMSCTPTVLPVDLLSYIGKRYGKDEALLEWTTINEKNSAYFQLLRSTDGHKFTPIANIPGAGNSSVVSDYSYIDNGLMQSGTYYYMLVQVDFDGKETMKGIVRVTIDLDVIIEVVPTVVSEGTPIRLLNYAGAKLLNLSLLDLNGKVVYSRNNISETEINIETLGLSSSIYIVKVQTETEVITKKVIVQ
jgi:parallel beta-helix repeat protein